MHIGFLIRLILLSTAISATALNADSAANPVDEALVMKCLDENSEIRNCFFAAAEVCEQENFIGSDDPLEVRAQCLGREAMVWRHIIDGSTNGEIGANKSLNAESSESLWWEHANFECAAAEHLEQFGKSETALCLLIHTHAQAAATLRE